MNLKCYSFCPFFLKIPSNISLRKKNYFCEQEYVEDGIDWAKVDFEDNQDCLNLFEKV